jgi:hypothetical protein
MDKWRKVLSAWDEAQHDPVSIPPDIRGLALDDAVEKIQEWFYANFEDPVHSTPYDSSEGGYSMLPHSRSNGLRRRASAGHSDDAPGREAPAVTQLASKIV